MTLTQWRATPEGRKVRRLFWNLERLAAVPIEHQQQIGRREWNQLVDAQRRIATAFFNRLRGGE